jgi:hypothetical protein
MLRIVITLSRLRKVTKSIINLIHALCHAIIIIIKHASAGTTE